MTGDSMGDPEQNRFEATVDDERVDSILDRYEDALEQGQRLSVDELCRDVPELKDKVAKHIAALEKMNERLEDSPDPKPREATSDSDITDKLPLATELSKLKFHAKGGLGAVYLATDESLTRSVAVKFIHRNLVDDPECLKRFAVEAEVTGRLEHPGVAPVYGIGESETGRPFYAMRFIQGETLDEAITDYHHRAKFEDRSTLHIDFVRMLRQFASMCNTIAYAHNRGIVHRDIKPANVMLGRFGETVVVDWGLAVPVLRDDRFRQSGERTLSLNQMRVEDSDSSESNAGTPAYMSPEEFAGSNPTPSGDIYALGGTLYKLLTGKTAVYDCTIGELRERVMTGDIESPVKIAPAIPKPLSAICMKAMALRPRDRYATGLDLARDIERYLADESVSAFKEGASRKFARWARRNRARVQTALVAIVCLSALGLMSNLMLASFAHSKNKLLKQTEASERIAESARRENLKSSAGFLAEKISYEIDIRWRLLEAEADSPELRELIAAVNADPNDADSRGALQTWLSVRKNYKQSSISDEPWCVYSMRGEQIARVPAAPSLGKSFRHRDYFHGLGEDLSPDDPKLESVTPLAPIRDAADHDDEVVYISTVFQGVNTKTLMIAFAVPIWDKPPESNPREIIGLITLPLEINKFDLPENALLFQRKTDPYTNLPGLIIAHPQLKPRNEIDLPPHVSEDIVSLADQFADEKLDADPGTDPGADNDETQHEIIENFVDPLTDESGFAGIEPVMIPGRGDILLDTGWAILVKENH